MRQKIKVHFEQFQIANYLLRWSILIVPISLVVGSLVALFLWLLEIATQYRSSHQWLLSLLPVAGVVVWALYRYLGKNTEAGNNLIMEEIHKPDVGVPFRMTPLVLITTIITHFFGGSAGREGTAVQMGGSISGFFSKIYRLNKRDRRILLMCGMSAGFGAVFGTPVTGAIFALEVLSVGRIKYDALIPCLIASFLANLVCGFFPIHHTHYSIGSVIENSNTFDYKLLLIVIIASVLFGLTSNLFSETSHFIKRTSQKYIPQKWLIPFIGGTIIIGLTFLLGTDSYLGLGVTNPDPNGVSIVSAFKEGGAGYSSWILKLLFTAITLGMGFKGGEVTPLFFIGATLGNSIATLTGMPVDLFAGLGFIAVFAGATNTPIACTMMGVELFGAEYVAYFAIACFTAYYFSGHSGIYSSQRVAVNKLHRQESGEQTIREIKEKNKQYGRKN